MRKSGLFEINRKVRKKRSEQIKIQKLKRDSKDLLDYN